MSDLCVVLCTCPNKSSARDIAYQVVEKELAACVNIVAGMVSIYRWQGRVQQDQECQLFMKTLRSAVPQLKDAVFAAHPYDVPEWIVLDVAEAGLGYEDWIRSSVR